MREPALPGIDDFCFSLNFGFLSLSLFLILCFLQLNFGHEIVI